MDYTINKKSGESVRYIPYGETFIYKDTVYISVCDNVILKGSAFSLPKSETYYYAVDINNGNIYGFDGTEEVTIVKPTSTIKFIEK